MSELVIIPAFNEASNIAEVIQGVQVLNPTVDIIVVNDGSTDNTSELASNLGVKVIDLPFNMGVGAAMRTGYLYAKKNNFDAALQFDGDGQHNPADISTLFQSLKNSNVVIGNRFKGISKYPISKSRLFTVKLLSKLVSMIVGSKISDPTSGYRCGDRQAINFFANFYPSEYLNDTLGSIVLAHKNGLKLSEIPVSMNIRQGGKPSQSKRKSLVHLFRTIILVFIFAIRTPATLKSDGTKL